MKIIFFLLIISTITLFGKAQDAEQHKALIRTFYDAFKRHDFATAESYYAPSVTLHMSGEKLYSLTPATLRKQSEALFNTFPDGQSDIVHIVAEGDWVAVCDRRTGTQTNALGELPATGKSADILVMEMYRLENGKITEIYLVRDDITLYRQLGFLPWKIAVKP